MLGREVNVPAQLVFPRVLEQHENYYQYVVSLIDIMREIANVDFSMERLYRGKIKKCSVCH
jgi:hypothetical protein